MSDLKNLVSQVKTAANQLKTEIAQIDAKIGELDKRRSVLLSSKVSKDDYIKLMEFDIARKAESYRIRMKMALNKTLPNDLAFSRRVFSPTNSPEIFAPYLNEHEGPGFSNSAAYFLFGELIATSLKKLVEEMDWSENSISADKANKEIEQIEIEIADLSSKRDKLVKQMMDAGLMG